LIAPAIRLAQEGLIVDHYLALKLRNASERLSAHPESRRVFLRDGAFYQEGDTLRQPELAATLTAIARNGPREFYEGATAGLLVAEMERGGGIIVAEDRQLSRLHRPHHAAAQLGRSRALADARHAGELLLARVGAALLALAARAHRGDEARVRRSRRIPR
jgi:hypothetical protein